MRCLVLLALLAAAASAESLRVMTFNVRLPAKGDGPNRWELRQDTFLRTIQLKNPDVMGTQELFYTQGQYIVENLPEYDWLGNSRRGNREDEHMGVFYKRAKLRVIEAGNFWLSDTPEIAGSIGWGASLPRMATWVLFEIRATGRRFYFFNTHFHHTKDAETIRANSAKVIARFIDAKPADATLILTGDFNTGPESEAYRLLTTKLKDARLTAARKLGFDNTWSGFKGDTDGTRIDWILYKGPLAALESETVTYNENGRFPSDHYPVFAVLEFQ